MLATTAERVKANTSCSANEAIRRRTENSVARFAAAGSAAIDRRLKELDEEWDVERCLETMAPSFTLFGLAMGIFADRRWLALPVVIQTFFLQHALQGWCPPLPLLRSFGVRTVEEIEEERTALKAVRGDFREVHRDPVAALEAAEA
jgi:hypothetical protein